MTSYEEWIKRLDDEIEMKDFFPFKMVQPMEQKVFYSTDMFDNILPHPNDIKPDITEDFLTEYSIKNFGAFEKDGQYFIPKNQVTQLIAYLQDERYNQIIGEYEKWIRAKKEYHFNMQSPPVAGPRMNTKRPDDLYGN